MVDALCEARPAARKCGFAKALRDQWPEDLELHECAKSIVPDAFEVHHDLRIVALIEVVDTNPISSIKAGKIADLTFCLNDLDWELVVVVYNAAGMMLGEVPGGFFFSVPGGLRDAFYAAQAAQREYSARVAEPA